MEQQRSQTIILAVLAVGIGALLLFAFVNRGPDAGTLTGPTWQLASITGQSPAYQGVIPAAEQSRYTIAFGDDGSYIAKADCNSVAGTYELDRRDGITITLGPSTLVACPDGSYVGRSGPRCPSLRNNTRSSRNARPVLTFTLANPGMAALV